MYSQGELQRGVLNVAGVLSCHPIGGVLFELMLVQVMGSPTYKEYDV